MPFDGFGNLVEILQQQILLVGICRKIYMWFAANFEVEKPFPEHGTDLKTVCLTE